MMIYKSPYYDEKDLAADIAKAIDRYRETIINLSRLPGVVWFEDSLDDEENKGNPKRNNRTSRRKPKIIGVEIKRRGARIGRK